MANVAELENRIIRSKLTKIEGEIAEYILANVSKVCFMTASDLAKELNTSNTSVNRTAKALDYNSFVDLQKELQSYVTNHVVAADLFMLTPRQRMALLEDDGYESNSLQSKLFELTTNNLSGVITKNSFEKIDRVVDLLVESESRYISGARGVAEIASKFGFLLKLLLSNVYISNGEDIDNIEKVIDISENDCIVVFSFNRYKQNTRDIIDICRERNAKIILITDRATAPFSQFADELLLVDVESMSFFNSSVAPMFLIEILCTRLALKLGDKAKERLSILEPFINQTQIL